MKVLIVDDEVIIRTGLCTLVEWAEYGFEVLEPAASAEEALRRFPEERPELIFTDIRMTGKSGLELAREVKREAPDTEIVIISGFDEFAYAQEALREGISDYLLKTSEPDDIVRVALKAKERLSRRRRAAEEASERETAAKRALLERLLDAGRPLDPSDVSGFEKDYPALFRALGERGLEAIRVTIEGADAAEHAEWGAVWAERGSGAWLPWGDGLLLLAVADGAADGWDRSATAFGRAERVSGRRVFAAAGTAARTPGELRASAQTALAAFGYRWLMPDARFLRYDAVRDRPGMRTVCAEEEEAALGAALKSGSRETLAAWSRATAERVRGDRSATPATAAAYLQSLLLAGHRWLERAAASVGDARPLPPWEPLGESRSGADLAEELTRRLAPLMDRFAEVAAGSDPIPRAIAFIHEHLNEHLSLQQVSKHVHLHPNYFSEMFKRETGRNYADYVREAKVRKAMALLADTPAKVSEIAHRVGYADIKHFNRLFKQFTGRTPTEYREKI